MHDTSSIVWNSIWRSTCHFPVLRMRRLSDIVPIDCNIIITIGSHLRMSNSKRMEKFVQYNPSSVCGMVSHVVIFLPIAKDGATWGSFYVFNQSKRFIWICVWSENIFTMRAMPKLVVKILVMIKNTHLTLTQPSIKVLNSLNIFSMLFRFSSSNDLWSLYGRTPFGHLFLEKWFIVVITSEIRKLLTFYLSGKHLVSLILVHHQKASANDPRSRSCHRFGNFLGHLGRNQLDWLKFQMEFQRPLQKPMMIIVP